MKLNELENNFIKYKYIKNKMISNKYDKLIFYKLIIISMNEFCRTNNYNNFSYTEYFFIFIKNKLNDWKKENIFFNELLFYLKTLENSDEKKIIKIIFSYNICKEIIDFLWSLRFKFLYILDLYKDELITPLELINIGLNKVNMLLKSIKNDLNDNYDTIKNNILNKSEIILNNKKYYRLSTIFYIIFYKYYLKNVFLINKNKTKIDSNINNFVKNTINDINKKENKEYINNSFLKNIQEVNNNVFTYNRNNRFTK